VRCKDCEPRPVRPNEYSYLNKENSMVAHRFGAVVGTILSLALLAPARAAPERSGGKEAGFSYSGKYAEEVKHLLGHERCPAWKTGPNEDGTPLVPPDFKLPEGGAVRDTYVAAATAQAWAAEAYARMGQKGKAENAAKMMMTSLKSATDLCGDGPVVGEEKKIVTGYIECNWLKKRNYANLEE
jgi:hypothetical protein